MANTHKLLIVDDSKFIRKAVSKIFEADDRIQVAGEAADGEEALEMLLQLDADVVTLDVEMPVMDGITTLKHMMIQTPTPTVMLSSLTKEGATVTFDALKYGAVDFVPKPSNLESDDLKEQARNIISKVNLAAEVEVESIQYIRALKKDKPSKQSNEIEYKNIVVMGAAEGGYGTLLNIIPQLPPDLPVAYLVVLYAASKHIDSFTGYMDEHSSVKVKRTKDGEPIEGGVCYLGTGGEYITVQSKNDELVFQISPAPFSSRRGSINMLMFSVAEALENRSVGIILSGEGGDGTEGIIEISRVGGMAIVQDPKTCLYKEMAKSALDRCKADIVVSDVKIPSAIGGLKSKNLKHSK